MTAAIRTAIGMPTASTNPSVTPFIGSRCPAKSDAYVATTLAWLGDPAAESYARHVLADLADAASIRPRRIASANLDLGLALVAADKPDEAAGVALTAVTSGRLVPSNYWRVIDVVSGIEGRGAPNAAVVREAFRDTYHA